MKHTKRNGFRHTRPGVSAGGKKPQQATPAPQSISKLGILFNERRYDEAKNLASQITTQFPQYGFGWEVLGVICQTQGKTIESLPHLQKAAGLMPGDAEVHNNLGVSLKSLNRLEEAEASYRRALALKPDYAKAHSNLGSTLNALGRLTEAIDCYRRALEITPEDPEPHNNLGAVFWELNQPDEAEKCYRRALELKPDYAEAHSNLGSILAAKTRLEEAEACYQRALALKPNLAAAHTGLANILNDSGRLSGAEEIYRHSLALQPDDAITHNNLGIILWKMGRLAEAETCYRQAIAKKPNYAMAYNNLSYLLRGMGRLKEAESGCYRAQELQPDLPDVHNTLGIILTDLGYLGEAEASCRRALELKPDYTEAYINLGIVFSALGRFNEACGSYRRALELKPDFTDARSNLLFALNYTAHGHLPEHFDEACAFAQLVSAKAVPRYASWQCEPTPQRLRIGLVSGDLHSHPVGFFLEAVLAQLDPARFELIAYPTAPRADDLTERIRPYFAAWKPLTGLSDQAAARLIHDDGTHILLDLAGHTAKNRLPVFAWKPAPVQVSWLGYFATTGLKEMDYLLGDPYVTPEPEADHFTETICRLPETYLCFTPPTSDLQVGPLPALASGVITFGSFNNLSKLNDAVVTLWAKVLQALPHSRLFLKTKQLNDPKVCETTLQRFAACGIASERLLLEGGSPRAELLAAYNRVDIALDPFPYPGGTTSVEALWMGVPVLTRHGNRFLSHIGESIAHNAGLSDWIAADDAEYVAKAVRHTADLQRLAAMRTGLRGQVLASPLFDAVRFARNLEYALWGMWKRGKELQREAGFFNT